GSSTSWLAPFPLFTGLGLTVAYALLGATWLVIKTEGPLQDRLRVIARRLALALLGVIGVISLWTPLHHPAIAERWFSLPNLFWFAPVPLLVLFTTWKL